MIPRRLALLLGAASLCATPLSALADEARTRGSAEQGAFPYRLAYEMRSLRRSDPPTVSADGKVAYVVVTPPAVRVQSARFNEAGVPIDAIGARIHISSPERREGASRGICDDAANQWNPAWSPDGRQLAFYSDASGKPQLWVHDTATAGCHQLGDAIARASVFTGYQPRWSRDGKTLFVPTRPDPPLEMSDADAGADFAKPPAGSAPGQPFLFSSGSEKGQDEKGPRSGDDSQFMLAHYNATLTAIDRATGDARTLVDARDQPRPSTLKVSPSGRWVSYTSVLYREQEISTKHVKDLAVVAASGGEPRLLAKAMTVSESSINYTELDYRWHPTEDRLVYLKDGKAWIVDFQASGPGPARQIPALDGLVAPILYFTRDGRSIVVGTHARGQGRETVPTSLQVVSLDGTSSRPVALPDPSRWQFLDLVRANDDVAWQPEAGSLNVLVRDRTTGFQSLDRISIADNASRTLASGLYQLKDFGAGEDHRQLFSVYEDIATPADIYAFDASGRRGRRISSVEPRVARIPAGTATVMENEVPLHDGTVGKVRTTLLLPPGARAGGKRPAIVMIYSGSDLSTRAAFYGGGMGNTVPSQIFTSRGYVVLMANVVLSQEGSPGMPLQHMVDVLLPQVYAAANEGYIDINRLAVSGQSYGGYSTAAIVSQTNLFRAAIPVNGTYDLAGFYGDMDAQGNSHWIRWAEKGQGRMGQSVWDNPLRYIANSPYYRIDRINTPMLIVAGEKDTTVPFHEAKRLFVGLRRLEKPAQLAIYPGEGHVIHSWSPESAADVSERMVRFLDKHLGVDANRP